jgi:hypothetical protein
MLPEHEYIIDTYDQLERNALYVIRSVFSVKLSKFYRSFTCLLCMINQIRKRTKPEDLVYSLHFNLNSI